MLFTITTRLEFLALKLCALLFFRVLQGQDDWLSMMIRHPFWRSVIYELSEEHQKCAFLNFAIQVTPLCLDHIRDSETV